MTGRFIAVVGPSGVGKDSVMAAVAAARPGMMLARRVISRPSEAGGEVFDGVSPATFADRLAEGAFVLSWQAHGLWYGIPAAVQGDLARGHDVMANLSRGVLLQAQERFPGMLTLVLTAPPQVLAARLAARGREDAPEIARRLARADFPMPDGVVAHALCNDGPLAQTVAAALDLLYPVKA